MIKLSCFMLLFLFISCKSSSHFEESKKEIIENKIIFKTGKELKKEKKLFLAGFGGSRLKGNEHLALSFNYFHSLNIDQARKLIIFIANKFLSNLNQNKILKDYNQKLYEIKNIKIMIFCFMPNMTSARPPNLGSVWLIKNKIYYNFRVENIKTIHEETYEEALKIIESDNVSVLDSSGYENKQIHSFQHPIYMNTI